MTGAVDVLVVSLGTTRGLRIADAQLTELIREAGATVAVTGVRIGAGDRLRRGYPVNDLVEAVAARRALHAALRRHRPRAVVLSSTTAALLAGRVGVPYAVWLDSPARLNRPGARNAILHRLERRSLSAACRVLVLSPGAIAALPPEAAPAVVVAPPLPEVPPRPGPDADADADALVVAYTPDPKARDLALVCRTWAAVTAPDTRLALTGIAPERARAFLARHGLVLPPRMELAGILPGHRFAELLGEARAFLSAARWEDFGQTPLQALDRGAVLVSAPAGGPFPALSIARRIGPRFVAADREPESLAAALERALAADPAELAAYRTAARAQLTPYRPEAQVRRLRDEVLPALLG